MSRIRSLSPSSWSEAVDLGTARDVTAALERGQVLFLPNLPFNVDREDSAIFSPAILSSSKNTHFDPSSGKVGGTTLVGDELQRLQRLLSRFSASAQSLVEALLPGYRARIRRARASFRPAELAGRHTSWRKDDTRLHIDSFPASPVQGQRILRVFSNVNPSGRPRSWRVGDDFERVAERYAPSLALPAAGSAVILQLFRVTKSRRTPYDALMLQLHDRMKQDVVFQETCEQEAVDFPSGSTWIAFTDQVSHAAMAGQYQLEQTFLLPVDGMEEPNRSPLRILERIKGRPLTA